MALRQLSTTEQRFRAVLAVQAGTPVGEVAAQNGVSRQSVHAWVVKYRQGGLEALADGSHRPAWCPHQAAPQVEEAVCRMRRDHPRWGPLRIAFELGRDGCPGPVPSRATVYRILLRHGLVVRKKRGRRREDYTRWQRDKPMELWQMDIVGGLWLVSGVEAKVVTGVDDHSRFNVIAKAVLRATGRAVCLAFAEGMARYGVPEEVLTDNGKQFTDRFGKGGEVLFDRICRTNGIIHRLTQPATPTTTGKVERFHQTFRELIDHSGPFVDLVAAQVAIDAWVLNYNTRRPHQSLDMAVPADRFTAGANVAREEVQRLLPLKLPASLVDALAVTIGPEADRPDPLPGSATAVQLAAAAVAGEPTVYAHGPVEFERVIPPSGNLAVLGKQFWLGPLRSGQVVTFWADTQVVHLCIGGARIKSFRSHLSVTDLAVLTRMGAREAGPSPLPITAAAIPVEAIEVDRTVGTAGWVSVGNHIVKVSELRAGSRVGIRLSEKSLSVFDLDTRALLRVGPNPLTPVEMLKVRGARPAGPPPQPSTDPVRVQRRASNSGIVMVAGQKVALGRSHARRTVTIDVEADMLTITCDDGPRTVRRTTTQAVTQIKPQRPRKVIEI